MSVATSPATAKVQGPSLQAGVLSAVAVLSMLHEAGDGSATRTFHGTPVLRWTLDRLGRCRALSSIVLICWEDQAEAARHVTVGTDAEITVSGPRIALPGLDAVTASRRWSDGWRGGLLGTCAFDAGFYAPYVRNAIGALGGAVVLVDPSAGLIDPLLMDDLIHHADHHAEQELCFLPAAPGLGAVLLRDSLLTKLAACGSGTHAHPGRLLHYYPGQLSREMLAGDACAAVPTPVARSVYRFTLGSNRQAHRLEAATAELGSGLPYAGAEEIVGRMRAHGGLEAYAAVDPLPRDVVLELNVSRATRPIYWPGRYHGIRRPPLSLAAARELFHELADLDETRLTLAGVGDPALAPDLLEIIAAARSAGLWVNLETDLLETSADLVRQLANSGIDTLSVHLPATTPVTYEAMMAVNGYRRVLENLEVFVKERAARHSALPLLVPLFVKCRQNLAEMEVWYDQWLRAAGSAVIVGPSTFAGQIPDVSAADMTPPCRRPCVRLESRLTILSDGRIVSCEQDVFGRQVMGRLGVDSIRKVWRDKFNALRAKHTRGQWSDLPSCAGCREGHRE